MFASCSGDLPGVLVPGLRSPKCQWLQASLSEVSVAVAGALSDSL